MSGETDLARLLAGLAPALDPTPYVFVAEPGAAPDAWDRLAALRPLMLFEEPEGPSAILRADSAAAAGYPADRRFVRITLTIHSSLDAVGMTAAIARALAGADIPANVVAATRHDHVFVPEARAEAAMIELRRLSQTADRG